MTLLDTARTSEFSPGGIGFSIDAYPLQLSAKRSETSKLVGFGRLDDAALVQAQGLFDSLLGGSEHPIEVTMISCPPQHKGFGSKSLLLNGLVNVVTHLSSQKMSISDRQALTGRGGTSGIGIHAFYEGGLLWDAGHETPANSETLRPSSMVRPDRLPIKMSRWSLDDWQVALLLPEGISHSAEVERRVFDGFADFPSAQRGPLWAAVFNGFLPGLVSGNQTAVSRSLLDIHAMGFKAAELAAQSTTVRDVYHSLSSSGLACGMSSMGPLMYVLIHSSEADETIRKLHLIGGRVTYTKIRNEGFLIQENCDI